MRFRYLHGRKGDRTVHIAPLNTSMRVEDIEKEDLIVWQKAHHLVLEIYRITKEYPQEEKFALVSQMRRAAVSIPANIAEGFRKRGIKDKLNFYNIAQGSLDELGSKDLGYVQDNEYLLERINEAGKLLSGLIKSIGDKR